MDSNIAIQVENLSKLYTLRASSIGIDGQSTNELWALKDVSFKIKKGESVGIIGPNGSGKSTLLKILAGITKPTQGKVTIKGRVASILDIGAGFHPELSGRENIFLNGQFLGFTRKEIQSHYDEIVDFSGVVKFIDEPVKNYSNGMYLRLAFSIMAHLDFDIYLFDEVLSVGDAEFQNKSQIKFQELLISQKTILFVSHNISELTSQGLFIQLETGYLKKIEYEAKLLTNYLEDSLTRIGEEIHTRNTVIIDFSKYLKSDFIEIKRAEFLQEGDDIFRTDRPTCFNLLFYKLENVGVIDFAVTIFDIYGASILTTTPLLNNIGVCEKAGLYEYNCTFPENFFGYQAYKISLIFTKNIFDKLGKSEHDILLTEERMEDLKNVVYHLENIIVFKLQLNIGETKINLKNLNITGGLLPILNWKKTYLNE